MQVINQTRNMLEFKDRVLNQNHYNLISISSSQTQKTLLERQNYAVTQSYQSSDIDFVLEHSINRDTEFIHVKCSCFLIQNQ